MEKTLKPRPHQGGRRSVDPAQLRPLAEEIVAEISLETIRDAIEARIEAVTRNMNPEIEQEVVVRTTTSTPFFEVTTRRVKG